MKRKRQGNDEQGGGDGAAVPEDGKKRTLLVRGLAPQVRTGDLEEHFSDIGIVHHCVVVTEKGSEESRGFGFVSFSVPEDAELAMKKLHGTSFKGRKLMLSWAKQRSRGDESDAPTVKRAGEASAPVARDASPGDAADPGRASRKTTPNVVIENASLESVRKLLGKGKGVKSTEESGGKVLVVFKRFKTARAKIAHLHGVSTDSGVTSASFETESGRRERLIIRNLPFTATEKDLRRVFSKFGPLREVHLPKKPDGKSSGFGFVEYFHAVDAHGAVAGANGTKIGARAVAVDIAVSKDKYERLATEGEAPAASKRPRPSESAREGGDDDDDDNEDEDDDEDDDEDEDDEGDDEDEDDEGDDEDEDDEGDDDDAQQDADIAGADKPRVPTTRTQSSPEELARTVFVRNLLFETTAHELRTELTKLGKVEHCAVVKDRITGRPRGSAFVRFATKAAAEEALISSGYVHAEGRQNLTVEDEGLVVAGRKLLLVPAVSKSSAETFVPDTVTKRSPAAKPDKRNLWLAHEGRILAGDPAAQGLTPLDLTKRKQAEKEKVKKLLNNPNVFVSKTRLSIRNLPLDVDEKALRSVFANASGTRASIKAKQLLQTKIVRDKERRDTRGNFRSKGYGFVTFDKHEDALQALRMVNNNPNALSMYSGN